MATKEPGAIRKATSTKEAYESPTATVRTDRSRTRNTEAGMSKALATAVRREESIAMPMGRERISVLDENGNVLGVNVGREGQVAAPDGVNLKDKIITHNHPNAYARRNFGGETQLGVRVGTTLSPADITTTIRNDAKEIRAVTKGGYLYSLKRPATGWGVSETQARAAYRRYEAEYKRRMQGLSVTSREDFNRINSRYNMASQNYVLTQMAKEFGWKYTHRRA